MNIEYIIENLDDMRKECNIKGTISTELISGELGISSDELTYLLVCLWKQASYDWYRINQRCTELEREVDILRSCLDSKCKGNGRLKQITKVESGLKIAQKPTKNFFMLDYYIRQGKTDEELQELFNCSKTTLWRWKKELKEKKERGEPLYK